MQIENYRIELRDIHLFAHHGVMEQERRIGAEFTVDIVLTMSDWSCAESDSINGTVSYADVYEIIKDEMKKPSNLLENVCSRIMEAIINRFDKVAEVEVTLYKDTPPMGGDRLRAGVTMKGRR